MVILWISWSPMMRDGFPDFLSVHPNKGFHFERLRVGSDVSVIPLFGGARDGGFLSCGLGVDAGANVEGECVLATDFTSSKVAVGVKDGFGQAQVFEDSDFSEIGVGCRGGSGGAVFEGEGQLVGLAGWFLGGHLCLPMFLRR